MEQNDITRLITTLLTAPTEAVVHASSEQRRIWISWLKDVKRLVDDSSSDEIKKKIIDQHMDLAPVWKMGAQISLGVTMRVSSIKRYEASASLGLAIGLLQASGSFGFMSESTSESILQARAQYVLSNEKEVKLSDYLSDMGLPPLASADDVQTAINKLAVASKPVE